MFFAGGGPKVAMDAARAVAALTMASSSSARTVARSARFEALVKSTAKVARAEATAVRYVSLIACSATTWAERAVPGVVAVKAVSPNAAAMR